MSMDFYISNWTENTAPEDVVMIDIFNVSNTNGMQLLRELKIEADYFGEMSLCDAYRAVVRALNNSRRDDNGVEMSVSSSPGRCTVIDCGRPPGYFTGRMEQLLEAIVSARLIQNTGELKLNWG